MYMDNSYLKVHYNILLFYMFNFSITHFFSALEHLKTHFPIKQKSQENFFFSQEVIRLREVEERKSAVICTINCAGEGQIPGNHFRVSSQLCLTLCDLMDCSLPGYSNHGIFQARILEWFAISSSRRTSRPRDRTCVSCTSCIFRWILYHCATCEACTKCQRYKKE